MKSQVDMAVANNMIWCGIVCDTHGIAQISREHVWGLTSEAPVFYPDIITINSNVTVEEVNDFIGSREIVSIKDSYANLDMAPFGYKILFEAEWIYHAPVMDAEPVSASWHAITTEEKLLQWNFNKGTQNVLTSNLLRRHDVKIFMHDNHGQISGFIANSDAAVVGISNVFSTGQANETLWGDMIRIASAEFPGLPLVGYEQDTDLTAALSSGWSSIGPLRVWLREKL